MSMSILFVDDDRAFSTMAAAALAREGFAVTTARSLHEARLAVAKEAPGLVFLDRRLPDGDGLQFLPELRAQIPQAAVLMITAFSDIASAVEAMRKGAADYLAKPVELADLVMKAQRAAEAQRLSDRLQQAEAELVGRHRLSPPRSEPMRQVLAMLDKIAATPRSPVLLLGETGTGKEVLARHLHGLRDAEDAPFVHVNCAALPGTTFESELFGHERGAFTDARQARRGLVEVAHGGTLFLDEIAELPLPLQAKLLTFLDSGRFRRLGASTEIGSSARVVAATNRNLEERLKSGEFREDLYFRLSTFRIEVPPLRARREDIVPLARDIAADLCAEMGRRPVSLAPVAEERLLGYAFPGNVRELRNLLERALVLESGGELTLETLGLGGPGAASRAGVAVPGDFTVSGEPIAMDELERRYARFVLDRLEGRRMQAAKVLGLSYPTFLKRIGQEDDSE
jgi:two-component system, NtrC family, response regulator AtoC